MEGVCKGAQEEGGISIGLLPETNTDNANKFVEIPIATGIGFARNSIIATAALCLIAIGGGHGTLSEIAYGLHFNKKVFTIKCNLNVNNTIPCNTIGEIIENICRLIFGVEMETNLYSL